MTASPLPLRGRRTALLALAALITAVVLATACSRPSVPKTAPSIRGVVTSTQATDAGGTMRVVWTDDPAVGEQLEFDAAQVTATADTKVFSKGPGQNTPTEIEFGDIKVGDVVEAWFTGPLLESYPVQAGASDILVIGTYAGQLPEPPGLKSPLE